MFVSSDNCGVEKHRSVLRLPRHEARAPRWLREVETVHVFFRAFLKRFTCFLTHLLIYIWSATPTNTDQSPPMSPPTTLEDVLETVPQLMHTVTTCTRIKPLRLVSRRMRSIMLTGVTACTITIAGMTESSCVPMVLMLKGGHVSHLRVSIVPGTVPHPLMAWRAHEAELSWILELGAEDVFRRVTSLTISSAAADSGVTMPLTRLEHLRELHLEGHCSLQVLKKLGQTCQSLVSLEVQSDLDLQDLQGSNLHLVLPRLTHLTVMQNRYPSAEISHSCLALLSGQKLTSVILNQVCLTSAIWQALPAGIKHITSSGIHVTSLKTASSVKPHLQSFTADLVDDDYIHAQDVADILRLSPALTLVDLTQPGSSARPVPQVFCDYILDTPINLGSHVNFGGVAYLDRLVSDGSLTILPDGLHLHMFCNSQLIDLDDELPDVFQGMGPLSGTTELTIDLRYYQDKIPHNLSSMLPRIKALNLYMDRQPSSSQMACLHSCTSLQRIMLGSEMQDPINPDDIFLLCSNLPSLNIIEVLAAETGADVVDLRQRLALAGMTTEIQCLCLDDLWLRCNPSSIGSMDS